MKAPSYASATVYEQYMGRWSDLLAQEFVAVLPLHANLKVLDVGCGTGSLTRHLSESVGQVIGLDPDPVLLAQAKQKFTANHVQFLAGFGENMDLPDNHVDAALALLSLHNVPNPVEAVQEMRRVVGPGGLLAACEWDFFAGMQMFRVVWEALLSVMPEAASHDTKMMPLGKTGDLLELWHEAGVLDLVANELMVKMSFRNLADLMNPTMASGNQLSKLIHDLAPDPKQQFTVSLLEKIGVDSMDEPFELPAKAHCVYGRNH